MTEWVASWTTPAIEENQQLIEWIRAFNARPGLKRRVHFYGLDMTGARSGAARLQANPRRGLDAALD